MSQVGRQVRVHAGSGCAAGDPNKSLFTATLAQNAGLNGRISLPEAIAAGRTAACMVRGLQITSFDANVWEVWLWANSRFQNSGHPDDEAFRGTWNFGTAGVQIGATGLYYSYIDGLGVYYEDDDALTTTPPVPESGPDPRWRAKSNGQLGAYLNVTLVNRSAGAKTVNGWFDMVWILEPTLGW